MSKNVEEVEELESSVVLKKLIKDRLKWTKMDKKTYWKLLQMDQKSPKNPRKMVENNK